MQRPRSLRFSRNVIVRRGLAACVIALLVGVIVVLVLEVRNQLVMLDSSSSENVQWTLAQADSEIMALQLAIMAARMEPTDPEVLRRVRLRFDIVYSRIDTLNRAQVLSALRQLPGIEDRLAHALEFRATWATKVDGDDAALRTALPDFYDAADRLRVSVRSLALDGIAFFARVGDTRRIEFARILSSIGMMTVALVGILSILIIAVLRLARQREREARLHSETRERIETILSTALDAVVVIDRTDRIIEWNGAAERVFGFTHAEAVGADMASLIVPDHFRAMHRQAMLRFARTGQRRVVGRGIVQLEAQRKDGTIFPVDLSLAEAQSPRGEIFVAFVRDISDRVRGELALKRARDRAVAGEKQKAELLAVMSHEMRTPLNGILGTIDLFHDKDLGEDNKRYLRIIRQSGEVLLAHVNDVLDISRLDAGKMTLRNQRFDLVALLQEIAESQSERARAQGNQLILAPPSPEFHTVWSDPDRLRQILLNLVSNAIKFTRDGRITIEADCSEGLDRAEIRVIDTGVGIKPEDLERIFDDFVTIDSSYGRHHAGTGLGLGISVRLAAALGGELDVESEPGDGSIFLLRVPLTAPEGAATRPLAASGPLREAQPLRPLDILLVEDNAINREVARQMLVRDGHRVTEAEDGHRGIDAASERAFDVILMDISMPGLDGISAARAIRDGKGPNVATPIVAATAHALPEEVRAFRAAGMNTVLTKPITGTSLRRALAAAVSGEAGHGLDPEPDAALDAPTLDRNHFEDLREDLPPDRLRSILGQFVAEIDAFLAGLPVQLARPEPGFAMLGAEAHRLAGSAGVFGAMRMVALLRQMQADAQAGDAEDLRERSQDLADAWREARAALAASGYAAAPEGTPTDRTRVKELHPHRDTGSA